MSENVIFRSFFEKPQKHSVFSSFWGSPGDAAARKPGMSGETESTYMTALLLLGLVLLKSFLLSLLVLAPSMLLLLLAFCMLMLLPLLAYNIFQLVLGCMLVHVGNKVGVKMPRQRLPHTLVRQ